MESTFIQGNPWGRARDKRSEWIQNEKIPVLSEGASTEILYFVCCTAAYDPRVQNIARSISAVLKHSDAPFSVLGTAENCCANEMREMGEMGLFEMVRDNNEALFSKYGFEKLMTTSPHCYHTFRNDYSGLNAEVLHYTQLFSRLIVDERIQFKTELHKKITYHDPCFLGKQNGIFDEPRAVIQSIPGIDYIEMDRSRERSLCCEGGGGRMWMESEGSGERLAEIRIRDAVAMGADILATACPFCLLTLEDAVKTTGNEGKIIIRDIAEIIADLI
jgi:Fe-S oxidoreductase